MLQELHIKNFAIIDSLSLTFTGGLHVLSGETGAGKSIIVGAVNLLMGGRASNELIRTDCEEAVVEAMFTIGTYPEITGMLHDWGIVPDGDQLLVRRTISRTGKNRIYLGGQLATIHMLSQIGGRLIDISGQYSQQLLLQTERHVDILDAFAGILDLRINYQGLYTAYHEKARQVNMLLIRQEDAAKRKELLQFQHDEIERAGLSPGEEEALFQEKHILANARALYEKTYGCYVQMYEDEHAGLMQIKKAMKELDEASQIDPVLRPCRERLEAAAVELEDTVMHLRDYAEKIQTDPQRLEVLEARLDELQRLKRKYGGSIDEILRYQRTIAEELEGISGNAFAIAGLRDELKVLAVEAMKQAQVLSEERKKAGQKLSRLVEADLETIGMHKTRFEVTVERLLRVSPEETPEGLQDLNSCGMDRVEFLIAPNVGEAPKPLSKIASGGEISRIVLAIKKNLAGNYRVATLLFDEVDAGIGGAVAEAVGAKLKEIAGSHQIICITHLPQIACFADEHYSVSKRTRGGRSVTCVELLNRTSRVNEIARMLGGKTLSAKTMAHAREMIKNVGRE